MKKINLLIDYPLTDNKNQWLGLSFPPILYNSMSSDPRFNIFHMNNYNNEKLDSILVFSAGSQKVLLNKKFNQIKIKSLIFLFYPKIKKIIFFFGFFFGLYKLYYYQRWNFRSLNYEKRLKKILKNNENIKIIHRLDGSHHIICKYYGYDHTVKMINKISSLTMYQSQYCKEIWENSKKTIFGPSININPKKSLTISNGVDLDFFNPLGKKNNLEGKWKVLHLSASSLPNKGLSKVLEFAEIFKNNSEFKFYLIGDQVNDPICGNDIKYFSNVEYLGFIKDKYKLSEYLRSCDIYLYPSKDDCSSNSILEAMASGLPVLTIDSGGNKELICKKDLNGGIIIDEKNPAYSMKIIIEQYEQYKKNCLEIVKKYHDIKIISKRYADEIYSNCTDII